MRFLETAAGISCSLALILILLLTSVERVAFGDLSFYQKEFRKYDVYSALPIPEEETDRVAAEMVDYLSGRREHLNDILVTIDEVPDIPFFNESECAHMEDVRKLFLGGYALRRICGLIALAAVMFLAARKALGGLPKTLLLTAFAGALICGGILLLFLSDFDRYFIVFHEIFFKQGNWMFDPAESRMINMLPEGFFLDCVRNIAGNFAVSMAVLLSCAAVLMIKERIKKN